jgi:hypothetical protein
VFIVFDLSRKEQFYTKTLAPKREASEFVWVDLTTISCISSKETLFHQVKSKNIFKGTVDLVQSGRSKPSLHICMCSFAFCSSSQTIVPLFPFLL